LVCSFHLVDSTRYEALHYATFSNLLLFVPFPSECSLQLPDLEWPHYISLLLRQRQEFHTHAKLQAELYEVEAKLRPTVSRPVRLGVRRSSGTRDQFFFFLEIFFRQLRVCYFVAPSLTRRRVCNILLLLV
jgi:hypothetical protein